VDLPVPVYRACTVMLHQSSPGQIFKFTYSAQAECWQYISTPKTRRRQGPFGYGTESETRKELYSP
jgi:hypothetical protein